MKSYKQEQKGIGLLELMLSLAIIAILLIMATRYYQSAHQNQLSNQAVDMFAAVQGAVQTYRLDHAGPYTNLTITQLVSAGYLPNSYGSGTSSNPWGGTIAFTIPTDVSTSGGQLNIGMNSVPASSCANVANRVNGTISSSGGTAFGAICDTGPGPSGVSCPTNVSKGPTSVCASYPL